MNGTYAPNAPNGHPKRMSPPRPLFQDEAGDLNNSHNLPHPNKQVMENINITLDASTSSSPPQSPRRNSTSPSPILTSPQQSPQQRAITEEYVQLSLREEIS